MKRIVIVLPVLLLALADVAQAQQNGPGPGPGMREGRAERPGPPPEAMEACKGKKDGDKASMKTPRGDMVSGSCRMVLVPERPAQR